MICPADATVYPDPLGRYALIARNDPARGTDGSPLVIDSANPGVGSLLLYDSHTGRAKILWHSTDPDKQSAVLAVNWLAGSDTALVVTAEAVQPLPGATPNPEWPSCSVLLVRPALTGMTTREIFQSKGLIFIQPSPTLPIAILNEMSQTTVKTGEPNYSQQFVTVDEHGIVSPPVPIGPKSVGGLIWSQDGGTTYFLDTASIAPSADGPPPPTELSGTPPAETLRPKRQWYSFDVQKRRLTPIDKRPASIKPQSTENTNPLRLASGTFRASPPGDASGQPTAKAVQFAPLWLVRSDGKREGYLPTASIIAPDSANSYLLADDSAVLYTVDRTVYAVSLARQRRPDSDAAYRALLRQQTMSRAKQIGLAMIGYSQDYDNVLPGGNGDLASALGPYVKDLSVFNNPETDAPAFTNLLGGQSEASISSPATTPMGYLAGPGGRAILMADGHVKWEDSP